jgi:hypothetical protein
MLDVPDHGVGIASCLGLQAGQTFEPEESVRKQFQQLNGKRTDAGEVAARPG